MERHLLDAIAINTERRAIYADISGGKSIAISDRLLASERLTLPIARAFDRRARPYQAAGIGVMCDEFVSMANVPPPENRPTYTPPELLVWAATEDFPSELESAWKAGRFDGVEGAASDIIARLQVAPDALCMTRHLVESIRRAARLATAHAAAAHAAGFILRNPERVSLAFIAVQVAALPAGLALDIDAEPAHRAGAPILCGDVPEIPR